MTAPYFFRNPKANQHERYPPPERYGWMAVLVVACTILAVASITWRVYNPPASAEWVTK